MAAAEAKSDKAIDLFAVQSLLFLPASNPRAIAKARVAGADLVILDLEDAVRPDAKDRARHAAVDATAALWPVPVAIRVNAVGTEWHALDLDAVARSKADLVVVPRAISGHLIQGIRDVVAKPVLAMIETASGVVAASDVAKEAAALIAGTNDLRADLRLPLDSTREPISASLQLIVLAARAAGAAVFDGVFNNLEDSDGFLREAEEGRRLGFDGKSLIHPSQIEPCHGIFAPSVAEVERAQALVEAFNGGAERFGDEMIERMHVEAAQRVLGRRRS
ncbi:MAG: HpcH/HpaI aldolase/citrate lyase family protein [Sphingomonas sp.]